MCFGSVIGILPGFDAIALPGFDAIASRVSDEGRLVSYLRAQLVLSWDKGWYALFGFTFCFDICFSPFWLISSLGHLKLAGRTCNDVVFVYRSLSVDLPVEVCSRAAATTTVTEGDNRSSLGSLLHQHVEHFKRTQD